MELQKSEKESTKMVKGNEQESCAGRLKRQILIKMIKEEWERDQNYFFMVSDYNLTFESIIQGI